MRKLTKQSVTTMVVTCILQSALAAIAVYGILYESPRSTVAKGVLVGLSVCSAILSYGMTIMKIISEAEQESKFNEVHALSCAQDRMIRYLMYNSHPSRKAVEMIERAFAEMGTEMGLRFMTVFSWGSSRSKERGGVRILGWRKNQDDRLFSAILTMGEEDVSEIFMEAESLDPKILRRTCAINFTERVAFLPDDEYIDDKIKDCIMSIACCFRASGTVVHNPDDENCFFRVLFKQCSERPNEHIGFIEMEDEEDLIQTYDFSKAQFNTIVGMTKLQASQQIIKWFDEAGLSAEA